VASHTLLKSKFFFEKKIKNQENQLKIMIGGPCFLFIVCLHLFVLGLAKKSYTNIQSIEEIDWNNEDPIEIMIGHKIISDSFIQVRILAGFYLRFQLY
jgi:hypothetical protein